MLKRYTNLSVLALCLSVAACSNNPPMSPISNDLVSSEDFAAKQEHSAMPPLNSGSQELFDRAVELLREARLEPAQVLFEELTADQPELAGPWVNLGYIHLLRDDQEQAQASFSRALEANPLNCDALNHMGVLARRDGRFADAEQYYLRCIKAQPRYPDAQLNLAILYELYMGRLGDALAAYNDFQLILPVPDNKVSGWVMDLERRVAAIATR